MGGPRRYGVGVMPGHAPPSFNSPPNLLPIGSPSIYMHHINTCIDVDVDGVHVPHDDRKPVIALLTNDGMRCTGCGIAPFGLLILLSSLSCCLPSFLLGTAMVCRCTDACALCSFCSLKAYLLDWDWWVLLVGIGCIRYESRWQDVYMLCRILG